MRKMFILLKLLHNAVLVHYEVVAPRVADSDDHKSVLWIWDVHNDEIGRMNCVDELTGPTEHETQAVQKAEHSDSSRFSINNKNIENYMKIKNTMETLSSLIDCPSGSDPM